MLNNVFTYLLFGNRTAVEEVKEVSSVQLKVAKQNLALVGLTQVGLVVSLGFSES